MSRKYFVVGLVYKPRISVRIGFNKGETFLTVEFSQDMEVRIGLRFTIARKCNCRAGKVSVEVAAALSTKGIINSFRMLRSSKVCNQSRELGDEAWISHYHEFSSGL